MSIERRHVSNTLRLGVFISFLLIAAGLVAALLAPPAQTIAPGPAFPLISGAVALDSTSLIHLGLLVLMLTPFARVGVLTLYFLRAREASFALVTIGVLCLLCGAVAVGLF